MKVIFSRKGFDSTRSNGSWPNGGVASPIIDGQPFSLPIPANHWPSEVRYCDLASPFPYSELVHDLTKGRLKGSEACHLDPDICDDVLQRHSNWKGAFGQTGIQQKELARLGVAEGDLFLFYGFFQIAERKAQAPWRFLGPEHHRIWGWLQVGKVIDLTRDLSSTIESIPEQAHHPHVRVGWESKGANCLYVGADKLTLAASHNGKKGWGSFKTGYQLTRPGEPKSIWQIPDWLNRATGGVGMTHHPSPNVWDAGGTVRTKSPGQEYIADIRARQEEALDWLECLFHEAGE